MVPLSILDLVRITQETDARGALNNARDLARHAEGLGYRRIWVAEHHNMPGIASAATSIVIAHIAAGTSTIRVGAGGIMLPNHSPLVIAEQFGTLEALFPGRIDLGLGRAPGTDQRTLRALRRSPASADTFPQDVVELQRYFGPPWPGQIVHAVPGEGLNVPIYLLGSSTFSAQLAANLGLPFAFASHFAPDLLEEALTIYRTGFRPSAALSKPYAMLGMNVFAADTDADAQRLFTSLQQIFLNLVRGRPDRMPPPVDKLDWNPIEEAHVRQMTHVSAVGGPAKLQADIEQWLDRTGVDEIIATAHIYDHQARLHSFEIAAEVFRRIRDSERASDAAL